MPLDEWSPLDYLLEGKSCPLELISELLEDIRSISEHESLLLFTYDHQTILRTLCFASAGQNRRQQTMALRLQSASLRTLNPRSPAFESDLINASLEVNQTKGENLNAVNI